MSIYIIYYSITISLDNEACLISCALPMQWNEDNLESIFREAVAEVATDYCSSNRASCNLTLHKG